MSGDEANSIQSKVGEVGVYLETLNPVSAVKKCNGTHKISKGAVNYL